MGGCSILGCKSRTEKANREVTFHSTRPAMVTFANRCRHCVHGILFSNWFPENNKLKKVWINATGRPGWLPNRSNKICSIHFDDDAISVVNKSRRIKPEAIPVKHVHTPEVSLDQAETINLNPAVASTSQECIRDQNQTSTRQFTTSLREIRKQKLIPPNNTQKCMTVEITPRKEKLLKLKLQESEQLSTKRLLKLRAVREENRRLREKTAQLETKLIELQCKMKVASEDLDMCGFFLRG